MGQKIKQDEIIQLGKNIHELREKKGLTQEEVTQKMQLIGISISRGTYSKIEMGIRHVEASELEAIRDILGTSYEDLLAHTGVKVED